MVVSDAYAPFGLNELRLEVGRLTQPHFLATVTADCGLTNGHWLDRVNLDDGGFAEELYTGGWLLRDALATEALNPRDRERRVIAHSPAELTFAPVYLEWTPSAEFSYEVWTSDSPQDAERCIRRTLRRLRVPVTLAFTAESGRRIYDLPQAADQGLIRAEQVLGVDVLTQGAVADGTDRWTQVVGVEPEQDGQAGAVRLRFKAWRPSDGQPLRVRYLGALRGDLTFADGTPLENQSLDWIAAHAAYELVRTAPRGLVTPALKQWRAEKLAELRERVRGLDARHRPRVARSVFRTSGAAWGW